MNHLILILKIIFRKLIFLPLLLFLLFLLFSFLFIYLFFSLRIYYYILYIIIFNNIIYNLFVFQNLKIILIARKPLISVRNFICITWNASYNFMNIWTFCIIPLISLSKRNFCHVFQIFFLLNSSMFYLVNYNIFLI